MYRQEIHFHKSEFNRINDLFEDFFSKDKSPFEFSIRLRLSPEPIPEPYLAGPLANYAEWDIYLYETQRIGEITYRPGPEIDGLLFEYHIDSIRFIQQLIDNITHLMRKNNFSIIDEDADLIDLHKSAQEIPDHSGRSSLSPEESSKENEKIVIGIEPNIPLQPNTEEDIDNLLFDTFSMKVHHCHYNPSTAMEIYKAIPSAWNEHQRVGGRWGPGFIADVCKYNKFTVSKYLGAFMKGGLREIKTIRGIIPIPHKFRSKSES